MEFLGRTELLYGDGYSDIIKSKKVAIFGVGGVGGYVAEILCRSGVSNFLLCDNDIVSVSNINRQIIATTDTVSRAKTEVLAERLSAINPSVNIRLVNEFLMPDNVGKYISDELDFVCDAIDTVTAKLALILKCNELFVPIISSMGAGNRVDPLKVRIGDIFKTENDPLARVMRRELRKRNVKKLTCVYSEELPVKPGLSDVDLKNGRSAPGSTAFVPAAFGIAMAAYVVNKLTFIY